MKCDFQFEDFRNKNDTSAAESATNDLNNCDEREDFDLTTTAVVYDDNDIQKALKKLEESRSMLDKPIIPPPTVSHLTN